MLPNEPKLGFNVVLGVLIFFAVILVISLFSGGASSSDSFVMDRIVRALESIASSLERISQCQCK